MGTEFQFPDERILWTEGSDGGTTMQMYPVPQLLYICNRNKIFLVYVEEEEGGKRRKKEEEGRRRRPRSPDDTNMDKTTKVHRGDANR